jgi:hypothetical protein
VIQALVLMSALAAYGPELGRADAPGEDLVLRVGETASIADGRLAASFERVRSDSRCPTGVKCFWAGDAIVVLSVRAEGAPAVALELHTAGGAQRPKEALVEGFRVALVRLEPSPRVDGLRAEEYRLTLRVTPADAH